MAGLQSAAGGEEAVATLPRLRYATVAIEELVARGGGERGDGGGQFVVARDQHDPAGPLALCRVTRTYERIAYRLRVLTLRDADGHEQTLRVTEEHPFHLLAGGWTPARLLEPGDAVLGGTGTLAVVANLVEERPEGVKVYNLEVQGAHTYFVLGADAMADADPAWAHNRCEISVNGRTRDFDDFMADRPSRAEEQAWVSMRARELQDAAGTAGQHGTIMSVGIVNGRPTIGTSEAYFRESVLRKVRKGEVLVYGNQHGEVDIVNLAIQERWRLGAVASGNATGHCPACAGYITANGGTPASAVGLYVPRRPYSAVFSPVTFKGV